MFLGVKEEGDGNVCVDLDGAAAVTDELEHKM
jgi:hypothetical protein